MQKGLENKIFQPLFMVLPQVNFSFTLGFT